MILLFVVGYVFIALEHKTKIDKTAIALLMAGAIWTVFSLLGKDTHIQHELIEHLGDTCEILVFLIGAMTIVDLIDSYGGFGVITDQITTRNKHKLLWLLSTITFFMSAVLDNMTTTIIMVMLLRRLIADKSERWLFAGVIVFYSDLPYLPWWADGMGVALMLTIPSATIGSGKENRLIPMLLNAVLLGFLISVAEHYLG